MKIKTNIRAGKGGASGTGQNGTNSGGTSSGVDNTTTADVSGPTNNTVGFYVPPTSRCVGI